MAKKPVMLMILDGFGIAPKSDGNAVAVANKPNYDKLIAKYPTLTITSKWYVCWITRWTNG